MIHSDFKFSVEKKFDYMCRLVLINEKNNYFNYLSNLSKREATFSDVGDNLLNQISVVDSYSVDKIQLKSTNLYVELENEELIEAIDFLTEQKKEIIIYYYFLGFRDLEISYLMNLERSTVTRHRNNSLAFIKSCMEDQK